MSRAFLLPAQGPDEIGRLGPFTVRRLLGTGGMGMVFEAEDTALRRKVALKVLKPELRDEARAWDRFLREARAMATLKHENLVTVYQAGQEGEVFYIAMELLEGESLETWMKRVVQPPVSQILRVAREIASGLAVIHQHGFVHRDIKPGNIWLESKVRSGAGGQQVPGELSLMPDHVLLNPGKVRILDLGLALPLRENVHLTQSGMIIGTPAFMSPEQAEGGLVDGRSDLFSLGTILYCLCTDTRPFEGDNSMMILTELAIKTPPPVHKVNPDIPEPLSQLVMQLLARDPNDRPGNAEAVVERLRRLESMGLDPLQTSGAVPSRETRDDTEKNPVRPRSSILKRRWKAILLTLLLIELVLVTGWQVMAWWQRPSLQARTVETGTSATVWLADLAERRGRQPMPPPHRRPPRLEDVRALGELSPHGILMLSPPGRPDYFSYDLGGQYRRFHAAAALHDIGDLPVRPVMFRVWGDNRILWEADPPIGQPGEVRPCDISVEGVNILYLEVHRGQPRGVHPVWLEPYLEK
jgi:serine/threonine protein kinase